MFLNNLSSSYPYFSTFIKKPYNTHRKPENAPTYRCTQKLTKAPEA